MSMITIENRNELIKEHYTKYNNAYKKACGNLVEFCQPDNLLELCSSLLNIKNGDNILDCGSGFGFAGSYFALKFNSKVTGLNITDIHLEESAKYNNDNIQFLKYDFDELGNLNRKFDKILFMETFGHSKNPELLLKQCHNTLNPNGLIFIKSFFCNKPQKEIEDFYIYEFWPISKIIKWSENNNLILVAYSLINGKNTHGDFLSLITKTLPEPESAFLPYILILKKDT